MSRVWYPRVRGELHWQEMDGVFLLSREGDDQTHVLNNVGALLLELANGRHSVEDMIEIVQAAFDLEQPPEADVRGFLGRAASAGLVE